MSFSVLLLGAAFVILHSLRRGVFHTNNMALHDSIFNHVDKDRCFKAVFPEILLCNLCFIAICALLALTAFYGFGMERASVLWGIGLGAFCMTWPYMYFYRLYAFWRNPAALVHFFLNVGEIVYAVCMADLFLTRKLWALSALLIPVLGGLLRKWTDETRADYLTEMSFETNLYSEWKKVRLREAPFVKKYGAYIEEACREYGLPPLFLTRLMLLEHTEHGMWYCAPSNRLVSRLCPPLCWRLNCSIGVGFVKPKTAAAHLGGEPKEIIKKLRSPRENIRILAQLVRFYVDEYPGAGRYLSAEDSELSRVGALEYDTLGEVAQLCRYVLVRYNTGDVCSRLDFADVSMDILLKSDAEALWKQTPEAQKEMRSE